MLGLQAKAGTPRIDLAMLACRAVETIHRIELNARLRGVDAQQAPAGRFISLGSQTEFARRFIEHKVVIVTAAGNDLLIFVFDPRADWCRPVEIERRALDRAQLTERDRRFIGRRKAKGVDPQIMLENVAV